MAGDTPARSSPSFVARVEGGCVVVTARIRTTDAMPWQLRELTCAPLTRHGWLPARVDAEVLYWRRSDANTAAILCVDLGSGPVETVTLIGVPEEELDAWAFAGRRAFAAHIGSAA